MVRVRSRAGAARGSQDATAGPGTIDVGVCVREVTTTYNRSGQQLDRGSYAAITVTASGHGMDEATAAKNLRAVLHDQRHARPRPRTLDLDRDRRSIPRHARRQKQTRNRNNL